MTDLIAGVSDGADLSELNAWLAANGLRDANWYAADSMVVADGEITAKQVVVADDVEPGQWPRAKFDPVLDQFITEDICVPVKVLPPQTLAKAVHV